MKREFIILIICSYFNVCWSQSNTESIGLVKTHLKKVNEYYLSHPDYSVNVQHIMFQNLVDLTPEMTYHGYFIARKGGEHSVIMGVETIQNDDLRVVVDTANRSVIVSKPKSIGSLNTELLDYAVSQITSALVIDSMGKTFLDLYFSSATCPLSHLKIVIHDNRIFSLDMWHTESVETISNKHIFPHTRIEYKNYLETKTSTRKEYITNHIVILEEGKFKLTGNYTSYILYDLTVSQ